VGWRGGAAGDGTAGGEGEWICGMWGGGCRWGGWGSLGGG